MPNGKPLVIRCGLHCGPVSSGIIGYKMVSGPADLSHTLGTSDKDFGQHTLQKHHRTTRDGISQCR